MRAKIRVATRYVFSEADHVQQKWISEAGGIIYKFPKNQLIVESKVVAFAIKNQT
jgi:hypothetical protein